MTYLLSKVGIPPVQRKTPVLSHRPMDLATSGAMPEISLGHTHKTNHTKLSYALDVEVKTTRHNKNSASSLFVLGLVLVWYVVSSASNNVSKLLLKQFPFPVTLSFLQTLTPLVGVFLVSFSKRAATALWRKNNKRTQANVSDSDTELWDELDAKNSTQGNKPAGKPGGGISLHILLQHWRWGLLLGLCSICGGVLHRVSLLYMHVSFVHTVKATQPLFAALIAQFWLHEHISSRTWLTLIPIVFGVCLAAFNEIDLNGIGMFACLTSTFVLTLSNVASKKMMADTKSKDCPFFTKDSIFFFTSVYALPMLFTCWLVFDFGRLVTYFSRGSLWSETNSSQPPNPSHTWVQSFSHVLLLLVLNSLLSTLQNYTSLWVLSHVSAVSHAVATTFKRIFVIIVAIAYFHNRVTWVNVAGIVVSSIGVGLYQQFKQKRLPSHVSSSDLVGVGSV